MVIHTVVSREKNTAIIRIANRERIIREINKLIYLEREKISPVKILADDSEVESFPVEFTKEFHGTMDQDPRNLLAAEMQNIGFSYGIGIHSVIRLLEGANSYEYGQLFSHAKLGKEVAVIGSGVYKRGGKGDQRPPFSPFPLRILLWRTTPIQVYIHMVAMEESSLWV